VRSTSRAQPVATLASARRSVSGCYNPWRFRDEDAMVDFCRQIFGLVSTSRDAVRAGLEDYFRLERSATGAIELEWTLCYAEGRRPCARSAE
jgi:hypothetical protein